MNLCESRRSCVCSLFADYPMFTKPPFGWNRPPHISPFMRHWGGCHRRMCTCWHDWDMLDGRAIHALANLLTRPAILCVRMMSWVTDMGWTFGWNLTCTLCTMHVLELISALFCVDEQLSSWCQGCVLRHTYVILMYRDTILIILMLQWRREKIFLP